MHLDLRELIANNNKRAKCRHRTHPIKDYTTIYSIAKETQLQSGEATGLAANLQEMQRTEEYAEPLP